MGDRARHRHNCFRFIRTDVVEAGVMALAGRFALHLQRPRDLFANYLDCFDLGGADVGAAGFQDLAWLFRDG